LLKRKNKEHRQLQKKRRSFAVKEKNGTSTLDQKKRNAWGKRDCSQTDSGTKKATRSRALLLEAGRKKEGKNLVQLERPPGQEGAKWGKFRRVRHDPNCLTKHKGEVKKTPAHTLKEEGLRHRDRRKEEGKSKKKRSRDANSLLLCYHQFL